MKRQPTFEQLCPFLIQDARGSTHSVAYAHLLASIVNLDPYAPAAIFFNNDGSSIDAGAFCEHVSRNRESVLKLFPDLERSWYMQQLGVLTSQFLQLIFYTTVGMLGIHEATRTRLKTSIASAIRSAVSSIHASTQQTATLRGYAVHVLVVSGLLYAITHNIRSGHAYGLSNFNDEISTANAAEEDVAMAVEYAVTASPGVRRDCRDGSSGMATDRYRHRLLKNRQALHLIHLVRYDGTLRDSVCEICAALCVYPAKYSFPFSVKQLEHFTSAIASSADSAAHVVQSVKKADLHVQQLGETWDDVKKTAHTYRKCSFLCNEAARLRWQHEVMAARGKSNAKPVECNTKVRCARWLALLVHPDKIEVRSAEEEASMLAKYHLLQECARLERLPDRCD